MLTVLGKNVIKTPLVCITYICMYVYMNEWMNGRMYANLDQFAAQENLASTNYEWRTSSPPNTDLRWAPSVWRRSRSVPLEGKRSASTWRRLQVEEPSSCTDFWVLRRLNPCLLGLDPPVLSLYYLMLVACIAVVNQKLVGSLKQEKFYQSLYRTKYE